MINNRYYIIDLTMENMLALVNKTVGNFQEQRTNNNDTKVIIKLRDGDETIYPELAGYTEYDNVGILIELQNPEWN